MYTYDFQTDRGFWTPFILGSITGGLISPIFTQNQPPYYNNNYYYPPYYNQYYPNYNYPVFHQ